jgi:hypothetical protein
MAKHFLNRVEIARRSKCQSRGRMSDLVGGDNWNTSRAAKLGEAISNVLWI